MTINNKKNQKIFFLAVILSLILCAQLTVMGFAKIKGVETYGVVANFHDFPNNFTRFIINTAYLSLNIIYVIWLLQRKHNSYSDFPGILKHAAIFLIIAFASYPYSSDIYMYLQYGLMDLNGINPFINPAISLTSDLTLFLHWPQTTSTYGPISQLFFMFAAYAVPVSLVLGVYVFKIFCVVLHIINAYLIWRLLKPSCNRSKMTMAYLINPLLLSEQVAGAHVDVFVCNALLLLIGCLYRRQYVAVVLTIWLGFLEKTLPIIWLPLAVSFLVRKRRWQDLAISAFVSLMIIIILSSTVLPTIEAWQSLLNPVVKGTVARSLHHLLYLLLNFLPNLTIKNQKVTLSVFTSITYLSFAVYYIWTLLQPYLRRRYSEANLILDIGWTTLILFLFATPWLMPWYPSVLLPITALITNSPLFVLTSLTFCISSSLIYGTGSGGSALSIITSGITVLPTIVMLLLGPKFLDRIIERVPLLNNRLPSKLS